MSDEKKKGGFWSWFGLGKNKQEEPEEPKEQASQEETNQYVQESQPEAQETAEKTTALPEEAETENTLTEDTSMAHASQPVPSDEASVDVGFESNPVIEETLANSTALLDEETEAQAESAVEISDESHEEDSAVADMVETQEKPSEGGFFSRLLKGLVKTKQNIGAGFRSFFLGKKIDDDLFEELEEQLLIADIGVPTTTKIINNLTQHATRQQLQNADSLYQQLKLEMGEILKPVAQPLRIDGRKKPYVILMVGVNGVGKTTTIGKLARKFQMEGKSVMLAAGDTFRAAAVEQLQVWGERNHIPVVAQSTGSDSASVIFDAMQSAAARNIDILIADTAGRLQNKNNLMDELKKIVRVMKKYDESAPHEIMLTLDAGTGQNAISQAKLFHEAVGLTGISLTKLDGTAKGGVIFAIADQFNLPIRYIGVGEKIEDLREFNAEEFIEALFSHEEE
ncbi:signal recognition particle-docking protein FtsY [Aggregatibacter actinomycetemcomitans]|uniref:signal recognition particle-docking protein FtsY n=1 Tax=Aggregatibacter actinomycetemcomitans TaxID=714 RepID=UPI00197B3FD7|nr:signal recognition particle-docking protein FtsY [Aggregatibacter actinomycetemcomitans]MBN6069198.1 signal recognition particle-docking protein FtsY [Aggregatibacter actinomycetemcomitans]MBN6086920.1 signal recognition particle-docking protein FtsY [Aggregatibacter actinomycetemcomitans]